MFDAKWDLNGYDRVIGKMRGLAPAIRLKAGRSALGSAARIVTNAAKSNAQRLDDPATAETIAKNITQRFSSQYYKQTGDLKIRIGVMGGARQYGNTKANVRSGKAGQTYLTAGDKGNPGGDTFYWRFLEFGTEKMPAKPFMRPAFENNTAAVESEFAVKLERQIDKIVKT